MTALTIKNLEFSYPDMSVLRGIDLQINEGETVGLIGPNGVGKTTLFHTICGLLKPTGGSVSLFDNEVKLKRFNPDVGLLFQYPDDQLFSPSVSADIAFGEENMGLEPDAVGSKVKAAMEKTGICHLADRPPHQLSGGQKRMVAIAGILAMSPKLVIYDEPSANLDMRSRRRLINFIKESEETVLVASHDLEMILELCDRVIVLNEGQIVADGTPADIMSDEAFMLANGLEKPHSLRPHIHPSQNGKTKINGNGIHHHNHTHEAFPA